MHYTSLLVAASVVSSVCGLPSLAKRADEVTWDKEGNLKLTFSKETVKLGTVQLDQMFGKLGEACHESGQCETNEIPFDGQIWQAGRDTTISNIKVTMGPDGEYPTWIRNGLLDSLQAAVKAIAKCEDVTHQDNCAIGNPMAYCPQKKTTANMCEVPAYWGVNYQDKAAANAAPPNIGTSVAMEVVDNTICEDTLTGVGAVAGAVHGVAGGIFTLLTFACK